jgi:hypothetical protein
LLRQPEPKRWIRVQRGDLPYPTEEPVIRLLEGLALLELHRAAEAEQAFTGALTTVSALLALADINIAAI